MKCSETDGDADAAVYEEGDDNWGDVLRVMMMMMMMMMMVMMVMTVTVVIGLVTVYGILLTTCGILNLCF